MLRLADPSTLAAMVIALAPSVGLPVFARAHGADSGSGWFREAEADSAAHARDEASPSKDSRFGRAVAAPNLRARVLYEYGSVDATSTAFTDGIALTTKELDEEDGHTIGGELIGTVPLIAFTGLRATVRGGTTDARRSLDALEPGSSEVQSYGGLVEILIRNPEFGAFAAGAGFDRLEGEGGLTANQLTGSAEAQIYFPDLGSGPLDWFTRFEFRHREVAGDDQPFDIDADVYAVTAGARWYGTPNVAVAFTGAWQRTEEEFLSEDDKTGSVGIHWLLPIPLGGASVEVFAAGVAGLSEYKESPFRGDDRLVYGGRAGLTLRAFSGRTLLESFRRFD